MKNWKKLLVLLLALTMVFVFAACNEEEPEKPDSTPDKGDENCEHVFTEWELERERTCTKKGLKTRECTECGKEEEEEELAFGHIFYGGECSVCGKEAKDCEHPETETVVMSQATCTKDGEEREVCKLCKAVVDRDYISAFWHSETENVVVRAATCTEDGTAHEICKLCNEVIYEYSLWATGHEETEYVVITEATCTENGTYQEICTLCGGVDYEGTIWYSGHSYEYIDAKAPTCTEIGWYNYRHCTVCDYLYNYEERPATGHSYQFGICANCGGEDHTFSTITVPGAVYNPLVVNKNEQVAYEALGARFELFFGEIAGKNETYQFTFEAETDGRYYIWLDEIYSGYYIGMTVYDAAGKKITSDSSVYNNEGKYVDLTAGIYTVELKYGSGLTSYNLHVGHAKEALNVSGYDVVNDEMEFNRQLNQYTFIPTVSGVYYFSLTEMIENAQMVMRVYNHLNEEIGYYGYVSNGKGVKVTLNAGERYTIYVENTNNKITPYALQIGKQAATVIMDGYNMVYDAVTFEGQVNLYQFVATGNDCRIDVMDLLTGANVNIELYNYLNERITYSNYCENGDGFNYSGLIPGQTYTIKVIYRSGYSDYTLRVLTPKPTTDVTDNMAVLDTIEYYGQANYYQFTADESGEMVIKLRVDSYTNGRYAAFYIYDAAGNLITSDTSVYGGDTLTVRNLTAGETYILRVVYNGDAMEYAISFT